MLIKSTCNKVLKVFHASWSALDSLFHHDYKIASSFVCTFTYYIIKNGVTLFLVSWHH
jgi:hypothetical protein